mmetsp:Transcript_94738/g.267462  ORF Transcript_94738/g.267462 Transcript_94738/m.267462 type:complete len:238 (+) Transcript_94738:710-1423(+)
MQKVQGQRSFPHMAQRNHFARLAHTHHDAEVIALPYGELRAVLRSSFDAGLEDPSAPSFQHFLQAEGISRRERASAWRFPTASDPLGLDLTSEAQREARLLLLDGAAWLELHDLCDPHDRLKPVHSHRFKGVVLPEHANHVGPQEPSLHRVPKQLLDEIHKQRDNHHRPIGDCQVARLVEQQCPYSEHVRDREFPKVHAAEAERDIALDGNVQCVNHRPLGLDHFAGLEFLRLDLVV